MKYIIALTLCIALNLHAAKFPTIDPSVVSVVGMLGSCTGVVLKPGYVVTAAHCVEFDEVYDIGFYDGVHRPGYRVKLGKDEDWAVIRTHTHVPPARTSTIPLAFGDIIYHVRHNMRDGVMLRANGVFLSLRCENPEPVVVAQCLLYSAMDIIPGDSGGPVFNENGEVIGIMSMSYWPIKAPLSMAVPIENVVVYLDSLSD